MTAETTCPWWCDGQCTVIDEGTQQTFIRHQRSVDVITRADLNGDGTISPIRAVTITLVSCVGAESCRVIELNEHVELTSDDARALGMKLIEAATMLDSTVRPT